MDAQNFKRSMYLVVLPWIDKAVDEPPIAVARICSWEEMAKVAGLMHDERALLDVLIDWSVGDFPADDCDSASEQPLSDAGYAVGFWTMELGSSEQQAVPSSSAAAFASSARESGPSGIFSL